jgi:hypoxanthine phosphoribosyltransferase
MRRQVVTLSPDGLARAADKLVELARSDGFHPDALIGIETGGMRVVEAMSTPPGTVLSCRVRRPSTQAKERSVVEKTLRRLPYAISNQIRLLEDSLLARKPPMVTAPTPEFAAQVAQIADHVRSSAITKVLVVDDAVDSGATLATVMQTLRGALPIGTEVRSGVLTRTRTEQQVVEAPDYTVHRLVLLRFPWSFDYRGVR